MPSTEVQEILQWAQKSENLERISEYMWDVYGSASRENMKLSTRAVLLQSGFTLRAIETYLAL